MDDETNLRNELEILTRWLKAATDEVEHIQKLIQWNISRIDQVRRELEQTPAKTNWPRRVEGES